MAEALTIGTFTVDVIAVDLPRIAKPGEVVYVTRPIDLHVGGHAANVSVDLVKLGIVHNVVAGGALGRDVFAHLIEHELKKFGITVAAEIISNVGTARNMILVVRGEDRRFHVYRGANQHLSAEHVIRLIRKYKPRYLYISIGASRKLDDHIDRVLSHAKSIGSTVLVDVAYTEPQAVKILNRILDLPDIIHLNTEELKMLTNEKDILEALGLLKDRAPILLCVTSGEKGIIALYKGKILIEQPPFKVELRDPTGAGDAFCAGVLSALKLSGRPLTELDINELTKVLMFAQASGAVAVTAPGATTAVSSINVRRLIESQGENIITKTKATNLY